MKKSMLKILAGVLVFCCLFIAAAAEAPDSPMKEEIIYAVLQPDGSVDGLYAVNAFELEQAGRITDYGDYTEVRNLSTEDTLGVSGDTVTANAPAGRFCYQGNLASKELPWTVTLRYSLDGRELPAGELAGKSGAFRLTVAIARNGDFGSAYFQHYALSISLSLDGEKCSDVTAGGAVIANAGTRKSITITHLPGSEKQYTIEANITDFEMEPIQIAAAAFSLDTGSVDTGTLTEGFTQLSDGVRELDEGGGRLADAAEQYRSGIERFAAGVKTAADSSALIGKALTETSGGLETLLAGSKQLGALASSLLASDDPSVQALAAGVLAQQDALSQLSAGLSGVSGSYARFDTGLSELGTSAASLSSGFGELRCGISGLADGISELRDRTRTLDTDVQAEIDGMLKRYSNENYVPASFVSDKNTSVRTVQFVMRTGSVEIPEDEQAGDQPVSRLTLWQKILKVFGLYQN